MKTIIKLGILVVGGYLAYNWYKDSKKKGSKSSNGYKSPQTEVPFMEQPLDVQMGEHLTLEEKEDFILKNGEYSVLSDRTFYPADGDTDDIVIEAALSQQQNSEGQAMQIVDSTPANMLRDFKCLISKMKEERPNVNWDAVLKDKIDSMYVAVKCERASRRGEGDCAQTKAAQKAIEKANKVSKKIKGKNKHDHIFAIKHLNKCSSKRRGVSSLPTVGMGMRDELRDKFSRSHNSNDKKNRTYQQSGLTFERPIIENEVVQRSWNQ